MIKNQFQFKFTHSDSDTLHGECSTAIWWPGGEGVLIVYELEITGSASLSIYSEESARVPNPPVAIGTYEFWAAPGTLTITTYVPGSEAGTVNFSGTLLQK